MHLFSVGRIHLSGQQISPLFDPPHSIKGISNNFLTKDIEVVFPASLMKNRKDGNELHKVKPFIYIFYLLSWDILELAYTSTQKV